MSEASHRLAKNPPPEGRNKAGELVSGAGIKTLIVNQKYPSAVDTDGTKVFANPKDETSATQQWFLAFATGGYTFESAAHTTWYLNPGAGGKTLALTQTAYVWTSPFNFTNSGYNIYNTSQNALSLASKVGGIAIDIVNPVNNAVEQTWDYDF